MLRSLQRAIYSPEGRGPLRPGQRVLLPFHLADPPLPRSDDPSAGRRRSSPRASRATITTNWCRLGRHCSDREQRAEAAERELTKLKLLAYLSDRIGEEMDAVVTGVESYGIFVQGIKLPAEGLVRVETLSDDYYRFDRATHTLAGHRAGNSYRLGDLLRVAVARVDLERRELDFRVVERKKAKAGQIDPIHEGARRTTKKQKDERITPRRRKRS